MLSCFKGELGSQTDHSRGRQKNQLTSVFYFFKVISEHDLNVRHPIDLLSPLNSSIGIDSVLFTADISVKQPLNRQTSNK